MTTGGPQPARAGAAEAAAVDEQLQAGALRNRRLDRELARQLGRPGPRGGITGPDYLRRLGDRPALPNSTEQALIRRAQDGDAQARAELVEAFLPLIGSIARTYRHSDTVHRVELLQEGVVGLLRALERFDPDRGVPFWGYASWWVRQAMQQLVAELTYPTVLSDRALRHLARLKDAHRQALRERGREPNGVELAERTGLSADQVAELLAVQRAPRSFEEPITSDEGEIGTFGELIADPLGDDAYERVLEAVAGGELGSLLGGLSDRERMIVRARYGLDGDERSLREIAGELGLSAERVRQLESRALGKLAAAAGAEQEAGSPAM